MACVSLENDQARMLRGQARGHREADDAGPDDRDSRVGHGGMLDGMGKAGSGIPDPRCETECPTRSRIPQPVSPLNSLH